MADVAGLHSVAEIDRQAVDLKARTCKDVRRPVPDGQAVAASRTHPRRKTQASRLSCRKSLGASRWLVPARMGFQSTAAPVPGAQEDGPAYQGRALIFLMAVRQVQELAKSLRWPPRHSRAVTAIACFIRSGETNAIQEARNLHKAVVQEVLSRLPPPSGTVKKKNGKRADPSEDKHTTLGPMTQMGRRDESSGGGPLPGLLAIRRRALACRTCDTPGANVDDVGTRFTNAPTMKVKSEKMPPLCPEWEGLAFPKEAKTMAHGMALYMEQQDDKANPSAKINPANLAARCCPN
eukprot:g2709.t1